jgi:hypothetical protein
MAGKDIQITAAGPAPTPSAPSVPAEVIATGNISSDNPPPAPIKEAPKGKANAPAKAAKASQKAPAPEGAPDTSAATQAAFEAKVRALEVELNGGVQEGNAGKKATEKAPPLKGADQDKAKGKAEDKDPIQIELDAEESDGRGDGKSGEPGNAEAKTEADNGNKEEPGEEVEPPEAEADKDAYDSWIKSLSKPAAKKIEQQRGTIGKLKATAAERITLQPTIQNPLSHIHSLEQLESEKQYWTNVRDLARKGDAFTVQGVDGKKLTLDPEVEEDAQTINGYLRWSESFLDKAPDAKERITARQSSKPWETGEKLAPGLISDKESFASKEAVKVLRAVPSLAQHPEHEEILGHYARSKQMDEDQKPTAEHPKGKFRWVKLPLDKEGNVVGPKKAVAGKEDAGKRGAPVATGSKPEMTGRADQSVNTAELVKQAETGSEDAFRALVAAKERQYRPSRAA